MDRQLAKKSDHILFLKVEQDGFDLGAQRRPIKQNDLPEAWDWVKQYKKLLQTKKDDNEITGFIEIIEKSGKGLLIERCKIAENGDYNFSGDRYKVGKKDNSSYPYFEIEEICQNLDGKRVPITKSERDSGPFPYYGASGIVDYVENYLFDEDLLLVSEDGANLLARVTPIAFSVKGKIWVNNHAHVLKFENVITQKYVEFMLNSMNLENYITGSAQPKLNQKALNSIKIPIPPLSIQQEIVNEVEGYQKIIDGARMVVDNYKPHIDIDPEWEMVELGEVIKLTSGKFLSNNDIIKGNYPVFGGNGINNYHNDYFLDDPTIVIGRVGAYCGSVLITKPKSWVTDNGLYISQFLRNIVLEYLAQMLIQLNINQFAKVGGQPSISQGTVLELKIPIPDNEIQKGIVFQLNSEILLIDSSKKLIEIYEKKIKDRIARVWGEDKKEYKADNGELLMAAEP